MKKTYYRNEYTEKRWTALINQALALGCGIKYNVYGSNCEIDSTDVETTIMRVSAITGTVDESKRAAWAEHIHGMIQEASSIVRYRVERKSGKPGKAFIFKDKRIALRKAFDLYYETGIEYVVTVIDPDANAE